MLAVALAIVGIGLVGALGLHGAHRAPVEHRDPRAPAGAIAAAATEQRAVVLPARRIVTATAHLASTTPLAVLCGAAAVVLGGLGWNRRPAPFVARGSDTGRRRAGRGPPGLLAA